MARAKKSYGQHFLKDQRICEEIAHHVLNLPEIDLVMEVGPGTGALTRFLYDKAPNFLAIEADRDVYIELFKNLPGLKKEQVVLCDFLKFPLEEFVKNKRVALVGNFPYNISSQIVFRLLEHQAHFPYMIGMFQKEVSDRIIAEHGSKTYGILSVLTAVYYTGKTLINVPPTAFSPPPKVQSSVILLEKKDTPPEIPDPALFKRVVKATFGNRRKMIRNSIKSLGVKELDTTDALFNKRPEQMPLSDFIDITNRIIDHGF